MSSIERACFGNNGGSHQLLSSTIPTNSPVLDQLRFLVDRPAGHIDTSVNWSPYWGTQRVGDWWALWRAEEDETAPRRNMIKAHVALLPVVDCYRDGGVDDLFQAIGWNGATEQKTAQELCTAVLEQVSSGRLPVYVQDIELAPHLIASLWRELWPSARAALSLRTAFGPDAFDTRAQPTIIVFPAELAPRWRGQQVATVDLNKQPPVRTTQNPLVRRLLTDNAAILPSDLSVIGRLKRVADRLERMTQGDDRLDDALTVVRTIQNLPDDFSLPSDLREHVRTVLTKLEHSNSAQIRAASLMDLRHFGGGIKLKEAVAAWVETSLPQASDSDATWILRQHISDAYAPWWRQGVREGISKAFRSQSIDWARTLWRLWSYDMDLVSYTSSFLPSAQDTEDWLLDNLSDSVPDEVAGKVTSICRDYRWPRLLARLIGTGKSLSASIREVEEATSMAERAIDELTRGRSENEVVAVAAETGWQPLVAVAARLTTCKPSLFKAIKTSTGLGIVLLQHLRDGGSFPDSLRSKEIARTMYDGVLDSDTDLTEISEYLNESFGAFALDHPNSAELFQKLNSRIAAGAAIEWWSRFSSGVEVNAPPATIHPRIAKLAEQESNKLSLNDVAHLTSVVKVTENLFINLITKASISSFDDTDRVVRILVERGWQRAVKIFRKSQNAILRNIAWRSREVLPWYESIAWNERLGFDRSLNVSHMAPEQKSTGTTKMKILFMASNPIGTDRLALDEEARSISEKIRGAKHRDSIELETRWAVRAEDLQQILLEIEPAVVHFSGHGGGASGIAFHSQELHEERLVKADALANLFGVLKDNIRIVVLNACFSEVQAKAIAQEIDFVVGMSDSIGDDTAREFAAAFSRGLAFGRSVQEAFNLGLNELHLTGKDDEKVIPKLITRPGVDAPKSFIIDAD